ncbi:hypothetical protein PWT90_08104 [Aphanocladium album]|nr:hypothetical protein PWT90_08104 [Aphanocladium album]
MATTEIPQVQTAATVPKLGGGVIFLHDYPAPKPGRNEVLAKVLYSGVCQSGTLSIDAMATSSLKHTDTHQSSLYPDLHTQAGSAAGPDGTPILNVKLPHVGGHEGVGRIIALGEGVDEDVRIGQFVGVRFASRICRRCEFCLAGREQHCIKSTNHLHHEDGSFQEYIALDADYLTILPDDIDPVYALAQGAVVIGVDTGAKKAEFVKSLGATEFVDFKETPDVVSKIRELTNGGADAVIVTAGSNKAFAQAADMLRIGGTLSCVGIPPGRGYLETPISAIVIRGLHITGNLVGSLKECLEAVDYVRRGVVKPHVAVRPFEDLPAIYEELEKGDLPGRIVLKIAKDE